MALSVSGPGALCAGARRSLAVCVEARRSLHWLAGPAALCVRARRSLYRAPALPVSGPGALCVARRTLCRAPRYLCLCPALSVSGPALSMCRAQPLCGPRRSLCWGRAVCVGARRSCVDLPPSVSGDALPALSVPQHSLCRAWHAVCRALWVGPCQARRGICVGAQRSVSGSVWGFGVCVGPTLTVSGILTVREGSGTSTLVLG